MCSIDTNLFATRSQEGNRVLPKGYGISNEREAREEWGGRWIAVVLMLQDKENYQHHEDEKQPQEDRHSFLLVFFFVYVVVVPLLLG